MDFLPLYFDIKGAPCLLIGGGEIGERKARLLVRAGATLDVCAPWISDGVRSLSERSGGSCRLEKYSEAIVKEKPYRLVFCATDDESVNRAVSDYCREINVPVNVVDSPALCDVITPAIIDRSPLIIAVSSGGESPVLARKVKALLDTTIPGAYGNLAKLASKFRHAVKNTFPDIETRRRFWENALNGTVSEKAFAGNMEGAEQALSAMLDSKSVEQEGEVYLVGAGPGDPDLLTFKALRLMQKAEVVLYDRLVSDPILDMLRKDAERIYVGKQRDDHAVPQSEINQKLVDYAKAGKRVLRLKGGDPFIFGRGAEEIELLAENNVAFQVVPGITAASGCASYAGIPLTHRDYSQSVRFITGHVKNGVVDFRWKEFVEDSQTLVFYMGLVGLPQICAQLIDHGKNPDTPAALVERGTTPHQRVHVSNLADLPDLVTREHVKAPTLLIIGNVVSLHETLSWFKTD
jgi:uroporphyrin-III C-methyltransferase/precorrin-2 dehydrogenase/sirohydrochlorin ferrochelatase